MKVITRFAPSPTGLLHIGGARTALFNYIFSKHHGGKFLLRIEDTDKQRSKPEFINAITSGLSWLNLQWDDNVVMQSQNIKKHQEVAYHLLKINKAYYCYCKPKISSELETPPCNCINLQKNIQIPNSSPAIRLKVNKEGISIIHDLIAGIVKTPKKDIEDFIILRSDQTPTYLLAATVDDINMGITHIIRGNDHLSNTFKQIEIIKSLNEPLPFYAHIPLIHGMDGKKLSKRHGAVGIEEYKNMGYINKAINNYLLKLGWSLDNKDIISNEEAITHFNIKNIQKSAARFDFDKLNSINAHYIKSLTIHQLEYLLDPFIQSIIKNQLLLPEYKKNLYKLLPFLQSRFKTLKDIAIASSFILIKEIKLSKKSYNTINENLSILKEQSIILEQINSDFTRENLSSYIKAYAEDKKMKLASAVTGLRVALTGEHTSPASVFDIMSILGKEESLFRIHKAIETIN